MINLCFLADEFKYLPVFVGFLYNVVSSHKSLFPVDNTVPHELKRNPAGDNYIDFPGKLESIL